MNNSKKCTVHIPCWNITLANYLNLRRFLNLNSFGTKCNIQKSFDEFYCDKQNKFTGKRNSCKECDKKLKKELKDDFNNKLIVERKYNLSRRKNYEEMCKHFKENKCIFLTTKDEYNDILDINIGTIKYEILCCNKIIESSYSGFRHKKIKDKCYKCIMNNTDFKEKLSQKHSNRDNQYNVPHTIYQEYTGYKYIKDLLEKDFLVKRNLNYCKSDFIIKPITNNKDEWIKVQLKTTSHIQNYQYKFYVSHKDYDNHLLILLSIEDKEMWFMNGNICKDIKRININKKTEKYKNNEICMDNIIQKTNEYYNNLQKYTEKQCNECMNDSSRREYEFYKKRENIISPHNIAYPEIEGTIYDLTINNYKIQDKVYGIVDKINYKIYIQKRASKKYIPYDKGDNDFYWLWLDKSDYFFIIPEHVLIEHDIIKTKDDPIDKKYQTHIYVNSLNNDKDKYWYNNYKYDIKDKGVKSKIDKLFTIQ